MIRKSPARLLFVGLVFLLAAVLIGLRLGHWWPAFLFGPVGAYLVVWATLGRAAWCRNCKKFSVVKPE